MERYKKTPKNVLIFDNIKNITEEMKLNIKYLLPNSSIDYKEQDKKYDLVFLFDYIFKFNLKFYKPISTAEIIFKRQSLTLKSIEEGIYHFSECEIRNGK